MSMDAIDVERRHEDAWYDRAIAERFFEREGFRRLVLWNLDALRRSVPLDRSTRVLSVGCGLGDYEIALAPLVASIEAIDLSPRAVAEATRRAAALGIGNLRFTARAFQEFDCGPGSFDVVYALGVVHHLPGASDRTAFFRRVAHWLAPGGVLYIREPSARGLPRRLAYRFFRDRCGIHSPNEEHLDPAATAAEVFAAGFDTPRLEYTDVLGGPLPWLIATRSSLVWSAVFAFDRAWLTVPGLRRVASQFSIAARRR